MVSLSIIINLCTVTPRNDYFIFDTEHRNMPLEDAMPFLSRNFDNFVEMMKQKITAVNEWVAPEKKVSYYLNLLADGRRVSLEELLQVDSYVKETISRAKTNQAAVGKARVGVRDGPLENPHADRPALSHGILGTPADRSVQRTTERVGGGALDRGMPRGERDRGGVLDSRTHRGQLLPEPSREPLFAEKVKGLY